MYKTNGGIIMFVECYKNNGIPYLRLVRSVRRPSKNDPQKITSYKHTELSIGPLSRFDDGKPDYVKRLKKSFKEGCPLIESLKPFCGEPLVPKEHGLSDAEDVFSVSLRTPDTVLSSSWIPFLKTWDWLNSWHLSNIIPRSNMILRAI